MSFFQNVKHWITGKQECFICKRYRRCPDEVNLSTDVDTIRPQVVKICESCGYVLEDLKGAASRGIDDVTL